MRYPQIPSGLFAKNRAKIVARLPEGSTAVVFSNPQMPRNGDLFYPYRQSSDFFYATGIAQEKSVLVLTNCAGAAAREMLFILEPKPELEQWEGRKLSPEEAAHTSGIAEVRCLDEFEARWNELARKSRHLFVSQNCNPRLKTDILLPEQQFAERLKSEWPGKDVQSLAEVMTACRIVKEPEEIALIERACGITGKAFSEIAGSTRAGMYEYELEAVMTKCFLESGADGHAFEPIIASGRNSCYLHYVKNDQKLLDGNLVLMDFGAEYANYSSDCTRVFPVSGEFTRRQRQIYEAVRRVFLQVREAIRPGTTIADLQKLCCQCVEEELLALGVLSKTDIETQGEKPAYTKYYMHGVSHFIGLDTHDVGAKSEVLRPGMVISCEPGIYIFEEETGIRLEDTILVTADGCKDLMASIPM